MLRKRKIEQDLRNHGDSPHDRRHDYLAMAADVAEFMRQHGLQRPVLLGHSMYVYNVSFSPFLFS
jgi:pimeloyl-ACP methyl ester carboxylesterase